MSTLPGTPDQLTQRGIAHVAQQANWQAYSMGNSAGWRFPVYDAIGAVIAHRWKRASGTGAKYLWVGGKPDNSAADWYILPGTKEAIAQADGVVYLANGEPALLAYHAAGICNVITTTLSEISVPGDVITMLRGLGATQLLYPVDNDPAGRTSALKWREALRGNGIDCLFFGWGADAPEKADANDLWMQLGFNQDVFQAHLQNLPKLDLPALEPRDCNQSVNTLNFDETPQGLVQTILTAAEERGYRGHGEWINGQCMFHEDENASAGIHTKSGVCKCFVCGNHSSWDVAEKLGIDPKRFYKQTKTKRRSKTGAASTHAQQEPSLSQQAQTIKLPELDATRHVNLRYISEMKLDLCDNTTAICSGIATGKTSYVERVIRQLDSQKEGGVSVLVITHQQGLAENISNRLSRALDYPVECYLGIPNYMRTSVRRIVVSYDSLYTVRNQFDLVVIDEFEQFHRHLGGGTMSGSQPVHAYKKLCQVTEQAGQVIALDAHMSNTCVQWLREKRGSVTVIKNSYRHRWGKLRIQKHREAVLANALQMAHKTTKGIVLATNSRAESWQMYHLLAEELGEDAVVIINGETSSSAEAQNTLDRLTSSSEGTLCDWLPGVKAIIVSPSVGTGIDIQVEVDGVFGVFSRQVWVSGYNVMQQLMRYRRTDHREICVLGGYSENPADTLTADEILARYLTRTHRTAQAANFASFGIEAATTTQLEILRLQAQLEADFAPHRSNLFSYVVAVAKDEGFTIVYDEAKDEALNNRLAALREEQAEQIKLETLRSTPVSAEDLDKLKNRTPAVRELMQAQRGYLRWQIELIAGQMISDDLYDKLRTPLQRRDFRRLIDILDDYSHLQERDRSEAEQDVLLRQRSHAARNRDIIYTLISLAFGSDWLTNQKRLTKAEIEEALVPYLETHMAHIALYIDTRSGLSNEPLNALRRMISRIGLKLEREERMIDGNRFYVYTLDGEHRDTMLAYARHALQQRYADDMQVALRHSVSNSLFNTNRRNPPDLPECKLTKEEPPDPADIKRVF